LIVSVGTGGGSLISVPCRSFARAVFLLLRSFFQSACADVHFRFDSSVRAAGHRPLTSPFGFSLQFFVWLLARTVFQSWDSVLPAAGVPALDFLRSFRCHCSKVFLIHADLNSSSQGLDSFTV
jgi:hypothetical protein